MKNGIQLLSILVLCLTLINCKPEEKECTDFPMESDVNEVEYDSILAKELGADEYGMKSYVMAFLKAGPNRDQDSATKAQLQRSHLDNITKLAEEGKLVVAGPFMDNGEIRGIYIFNVQTIEEAEQLTQTDPAIQAGSLVMELHPWYGSAGLVELQEIHKKIAKKAI